MDCETTREDLDRLRKVHSIPNDIDLRIPNNSNSPSRPPKGYTTLYFECFKFTVRLPF